MNRTARGYTLLKTFPKVRQLNAGGMELLTLFSIAYAQNGCEDETFLRNGGTGICPHVHERQVSYAFGVDSRRTVRGFRTHPQWADDHAWTYGYAFSYPSLQQLEMGVVKRFNPENVRAIYRTKDNANSPQYRQINSNLIFKPSFISTRRNSRACSWKYRGNPVFPAGMDKPPQLDSGPDYLYLCHS